MSEIPVGIVNPVKMLLLYQNCTKKVQRFCYRLLGNEEEATDVAMDALIKTALHPSDYDPESPCRLYFRSARNLCIDRLRKPSSRYTADVDEWADVVGDEDVAYDGALWRAAFGTPLYHCLNRLSEAEYLCLMLYHVEEFTYEEIAEILNITTHQVRYRLNGKKDSEGNIKGKGSLLKMEECLRRQGVSE